VTVAALVTTEPFGSPPSTLKAIEKTAVELAGIDAIVQLIVPPEPEGVVQENWGPEVCTSDTKVVPKGTSSERTTFCASSGPLLVTSTL
jgi:hypothetical protein